MMYYKSVRIINGKPKWVIADEYDNMIEDPTIEQIKAAVLEDTYSYRRQIFKKRMKGRKCCICNNYGTRINSTSGSPQWHSHICDKKDCARYICDNCWGKSYRCSDFRSGNLDPDSTSGKGFIAEMIVAKTRNLKNCNIELDNFHATFDLSIDPEYGKLQVKGPSISGNRWKATFNSIEHNFDHVFVVCMDRHRKHVERVYIVPRSKLIGKKAVLIYKDWSKIRGISEFEWIEEYRVDARPYDDTFHSLKLKDCKILSYLK